MQATLPTDTLTLRGGERLTLRPVQPHDDWLLAELINAASDSVRQRRFPSTAGGPATPARLQALACVDQRRHVALVVTHVDEPSGVDRIVAEARYRIDADGCSAEVALMVDERWQRRGIGTWLLRALSDHAARAGLSQLHAEVMEHNTALLAWARRCRFRCTTDAVQPRVVCIVARPQAWPRSSERAAFWRRLRAWRYAVPFGVRGTTVLSKP